MSAIQADVLAWLADKAEGAKTEHMAAAIGWSVRGIRTRLTAMRVKGLIMFSGYCSQHGVWHLPRHAETAHRAYLRDMEARIARKTADSRAYEKRRSAERKAARQLRPIQIEQPHSDDRDTWPVLQRIVPASQAAPLRTRAPASVWELAA